MRMRMRRYVPNGLTLSLRRWDLEVTQVPCCCNDKKSPVVAYCCKIISGLTVIFSSGDDGIGGYNIQSDPVAACKKTNPYWPASSPYVTSVGATQLTEKYLPVCGKTFSVT